MICARKWLSSMNRTISKTLYKVYQRVHNYIKATSMAATTPPNFTTALPKIECTEIEDVQVITFLEGAPRATLSCQQCFTSPGKHSFEVFMKDKKCKMAVGFLSENKTTEYMRDTPIGEYHISFGGAGWIHPKEIKACYKYAQGDRVKAEVDFDAGVIRFYVNAQYAGEDVWQGSNAYPAISSDGGPNELELTF